MGIVTVEKLENADKDADSLELFIEGGRTEVVKTRKNKQYPTLENAVYQVIETGGFEPFATEADLLASVPAALKKAAKALDTKKIWFWNGVWNDTGLGEKELAEFQAKSMIRYTSSNENILNTVGINVGKFINLDGTLANDYPNWSYTDLIPVKNEDLIQFNIAIRSLASALSAYDKSGKFITSLYSVSSNNIIENNLSVIKIESKDIAFIKLCYYSASTITSPYLKIIKSKQINSLIDTNYIADTLFNNTNLFNPQTVTSGYYLSSNVPTVASTWLHSDYIAVEGGCSYTTNATSGASSNYGLGVHFYDADKNFVGIGAKQQANESFVVPPGVSFIRFNFYLTPNLVVLRKGDSANQQKFKQAVLDIVSSYSKKTLMTFGDSITDSMTRSFTYPPIVAENLGMNLIDVGRSGGRIRNAYYHTAKLTDDAIQSASIITIAFGTNDFKLETPLGDINSPLTDFSLFFDSEYTKQANKNGTFYGDYKSVIENILRVNVNARIILITPIRRNDLQINGINLELKAYVDAVKEIAKYYALPCLDNHNTSGFNEITIPNWTLDGLHPTEWAHRNIMAVKIGNFIESN